MYKESLHPYLQTIMQNVQAGAPPAMPPAPPDYGSAPQDDSTPLLDQSAGMEGMGAQAYQQAQGAPQMQEAPPAEAPPQMQGAPPGDPNAGLSMPPEDDGTGEAPVAGMDPNDPLMVGNEEGLYAVNPDAMVGVLGKLLTAKYALWILYQHYGSTLLARFRDGIHSHFQEHAAEEQAMAYALAKKIVALGGQAAPKVAGLRPAMDFQSALMELLKAEQKSIKLWRELDVAAGQNLGLKTMAGDGARDDTAHADDLRRYLRAAE